MDPTDQTVLVAVNGKSESEKAIATASSIAGAMGLHLNACLVAEFEEDPKAAQARLDDCARGTNCDTASSLRFPDYYDDEDAGRTHAICGEARRRHAGLIVVGQHRKGGASALEGTVTERLLRESRVPVLVATSARTTPYARAIVAVDFSAYTQAAIAMARRVAPDAELILAHAHRADLPKRLAGRGPSADTLAQREAELERLAADLSGPVRSVVGTDAPSKMLADLVAREDAELVIMGTRGRTGLARVVLGSVATALVQNPPCDVLLVPATDPFVT
jgi:nucleotide-binding universal stress UspA family protein